MVLAADPDRSSRHRVGGIAAVLRGGIAFLVRQEAFAQRIAQIGIVVLGLVLDRDQRRGMARRFEGFGDHQRNRLAAEVDAAVMEWKERWPRSPG